MLRAPRRQTGAIGPAALLPPSTGLQSVMAVVTAHVRELGPLPAACVPRQVVERVAEGDDLTGRKGAHSMRVVPVPVRRHRLRIVVQLEREDGMSGRDQLVIDFAAAIAEVTD